MAKLRRNVAGNDVDRLDVREWRPHPVQLIQPLIHGDAIDHVKEAVVDAADVQQAVVFGSPAWQCCHRFLHAARHRANRDASDRLARNRRARGRRVGFELVSHNHVDRCPQCEAKRDVDWQRSVDGHRVIDRLETRHRNTQQISTARDGRERESSCGVGHRGVDRATYGIG